MISKWDFDYICQKYFSMNLLKVFVGLSFLFVFSNLQAQKDSLQTNIVEVDCTPPVKYEETYLSEED